MTDGNANGGNANGGNANGGNANGSRHSARQISVFCQLILEAWYSL
jgi:hypothetical protein